MTLPYNWSTDRGGHAIVAIIAHNTVGKDSRGYLSRGGSLPGGSDRKVSIHILIDKAGVVYRYVPDERGANHAGFGTMPRGFPQVNPNVCTLSFELENASDGISVHDPYTDAQLQAMGFIIRSWREKYGNLPIFRHADIDPARRKDTVGLTVAQIESYAQAAPVPSPLRYQFIYPQVALTSNDIHAALAAPPDAPHVYQPGDVIEVDDITGNMAHDRTGIGFVPLPVLRKL